MVTTENLETTKRDWKMKSPLGVYHSERTTVRIVLAVETGQAMGMVQKHPNSPWREATHRLLELCVRFTKYIHCSTERFLQILKGVGNPQRLNSRFLYSFFHSKQIWYSLCWVPTFVTWAMEGGSFELVWNTPTPLPHPKGCWGARFHRRNRGRALDQCLLLKASVPGEQGGPTGLVSSTSLGKWPSAWPPCGAPAVHSCMNVAESHGPLWRGPLPLPCPFLQMQPSGTPMEMSCCGGTGGREPE